MKKQTLKIPYKRLLLRDQAVVCKTLTTKIPYPDLLIKKVLRDTNPIVTVIYEAIELNNNTLERLQLEAEEMNTTQPIKK